MPDKFFGKKNVNIEYLLNEWSPRLFETGHHNRNAHFREKKLPQHGGKQTPPILEAEHWLIGGADGTGGAGGGGGKGRVWILQSVAFGTGTWGSLGQPGRNREVDFLQ